MFDRTFGSVTAAAALIFFASAAFAAGEITITQAKVMAGNVTAGDTAGFPVTISQPGSYILAGNLQVPANALGIEITSRDVTVDLKGFRINGSGTARYGVHAGTREGITVKNGTIIGFKLDGIWGSGNSWNVEGVRVLNSGRNAIDLSQSKFTHIQKSTIVGNAGNGVHCGESCRIEGNIISANGGIGIVANGYSSVTANNANQNGNGGISCHLCLIESNVVSANSNVGVYGDGATVLNTSIFDNTGVGVSALSFSGSFGNSRLSRNNADGSQQTGFFPIHPNFCNGTC